MDPVPAVSDQLQYIMIDWVGGLRVDCRILISMCYHTPLYTLDITTVAYEEEKSHWKIICYIKKINKSESHCVLYAIYIN